MKEILSQRPDFDSIRPVVDITRTEIITDETENAKSTTIPDMGLPNLAGYFNQCMCQLRPEEYAAGSRANPEPRPDQHVDQPVLR